MPKKALAFGSLRQKSFFVIGRIIEVLYLPANSFKPKVVKPQKVLESVDKKVFYYKPNSIFLDNVSTDTVPNQFPQVLIEILPSFFSN